jgi:hypothetical protein
MQARTHRDIAFFDAAVRQLRMHFEQLETRAASERGAPVRRKPR